MEKTPERLVDKWRRMEQSAKENKEYLEYLKRYHTRGRRPK